MNGFASFIRIGYRRMKNPYETEVITMKKLFAIILSVVLVAAFSITAYAGTGACRGGRNAA